MIGKQFETLVEIDCHSRYNRLVKAQRDGHWWMLKGLKPEYQTDPVMCELLHKEFNLGMMLRHRGIVSFFALEYVQQLNGEFIVQEWVEGETLKRWLDDKHTWQKKVDVLLQLCNVLDYCHSMNVLHRDIKPSNIMITPDGRVKIIDMGLSIAGNQSAFRAPAGTKQYMAPEQSEKDINVDGRVDLYAMGCIMREMGLPRHFNPVMRRLLQTNLEKRYPDAHSLSIALNDASRNPRRYFMWVGCVLILVTFSLIAYKLGGSTMSYSLLGTGTKLAPTLPDYLITDTVNPWAADTAHFFTVNEGNMTYSFPKMPHEIPGDIPEDIAVDLGLNVMWAPFNVGCGHPSLLMTGGFYGYGEPTGKLMGTKEGNNSLYWNSNYLDDYSGTEYDIARMQWGGRWRSPRKADMDELLNRCQWTFLRPKGCLPGYLVIGPNGNRIFLPLAGFRYEDQYYECGKMGYYWLTSSHIETTHGIVSFVGLAIWMVPEGMSYGYAMASDGFSVRPVLDR